jgi:hypothetical protein
MRALRTLLLALLCACVVGGVTSPSASASVVLLDAVTASTFDNYCVHLGDSSARTIRSDAYGWRCVSASGLESPINVDDVCKWAAPNTFPHTKGRIRDFHNVEGWECWGFNATLGNLTLEDFSNFCRSIGSPDGAKVIPPGDAYSIRCEPGDQVFSVTQACRWRFNSADAQNLTGDFYEAISWTCWDGASPAAGGAPPNTTTNQNVRCVGGVVSTACPQTATPPPGRACLFIDPTATTPVNRGHVAWAYQQTIDRTWRFGSTDGPFRLRDGWDFLGHSWWETSTTFTGVLKSFRAAAVPYASYRCTNVTASSAAAADKEVAAQFASPYLGVANTSLTRAVAILRAYGASLPGAGVSGYPALPNDYVAHNVAGWEALKRLSSGRPSRSALSVPGAPIELRGARPTLYLSVSSSAAGSLAVLVSSPVSAQAAVAHRRITGGVYLRRTLAIHKGRNRIRLRLTRAVARGRHAARLTLTLRSSSRRTLASLERSVMLAR